MTNPERSALVAVVIEGIAGLPDDMIDNLAFHYGNGCEIAAGPDAVLHTPGSA